MPRRLEFERDLIDIRISRKTYNLIKSRKRFQEPNYAVVNRIVLSYLSSDAADWEAMYYDTLETLKMVREKKSCCEKCGSSIQTKLI